MGEIRSVIPTIHSALGAVSVLEETKFKLYLVGRNMEVVTRVKFTTANNTQGGDCKGDSGVSHHQTQTFEAQDDEFGRLGYKFVDISGKLN